MRLSTASVFTGTAAVLPLVAVIAPLGTAPLLVIAVVAVSAVRLRDGEGFDVFFNVPAAVLFLLLLWAAITLIWSPQLAHGATTIARMAFVFAAGLVFLDSARKLTPAERQACGKALMLSVMAAVLYLAIDIYGNGILRGAILKALGGPEFAPYLLNRPVTILALLVWPVLIVLGHRYGSAAVGVGLASAVGLLGGTASATALVGLAAGAVVFLLASLSVVAPALRAVATIGAVLSVFALSLLSGAADDIRSWHVDSPTENSLIHRVFIWDFAATRALEKPWFGWGIDASRVLAEQYPQKVAPLAGESPLEAQRRAFLTASLPLHPHNAGLQIRVELGAVGALLFAGLVGWLFWSAGDRARWSGASGPMLAHAVTGYAIASSSFGIWQGWWMSALWLSTILTLAVAPLSASPEGRGYRRTSRQSALPTLRQAQKDR